MPNWGDVGEAVGQGVLGGYGGYRAYQSQLFDEKKLAQQMQIEKLKADLAQQLESLRTEGENKREQMRVDAATGRQKQAADDKAKENTAKAVAGTMTPWQEVSPDDASKMAGTDMGARMLPVSRQGPPADEGVPDEMGPRNFNVWEPSDAEQKDLQTKQEREAIINTLPDGPAKRAAQLRDKGITVTPEQVETPDERTTRQKSDDLRHVGLVSAEEDAREKVRQKYKDREDKAGKDDPTLPRGVKSYIEGLALKPGNTFDAARREVDGTWDSLTASHPKLDRLKVDKTLREAFTKAPDQRNDPLAALGLSSKNTPPAAAAGARPQQPRVVTLDQVKAVAAKNGTSVEQERRRAESEGFVVR